MSSLVALLHHAIYVCLLGFLLTLIMLPHIGAQQPSLPPGPDPNPGPSQWMIWVVIALMALFTTIYSIFLARCSPAVAADGGGFSWPVWAGRTMMARGLDAAVIDTFPMLVYADVKGMKLGKGALECVVCLSEFKDHETLRLIPKCDHVFHPDCVDEWFAFHSTCPVCRAELAPQSGESPRAIIPAVSMTQATESSIQENRTGDVECGQDEQEPPSVNNTPNQSRRCEPVSFRTCRFPRSHSTGHSLVQPGEDTERFTLRLPVEVRKQLMDCAVSMAGSSRRGNQTGGEGSSRGRYLRRPQVQDWAFRSERWVFARLPSFFRSSPAASPRTPSSCATEGGSLGQVSRFKEAYASSEPARPPI